MSKIITISFFVFIFLASIAPLRDFDIWFHLKSGEVISQQGIIHHDVFAFTTQNREWFPYEWLFQVSLYHINQLFGFESIKYFIALFVAAMIFAIYLILNRISIRDKFIALFCCFFFFASIYEFFTARPHVVAYTFLVFNLYLILSFYFSKRSEEKGFKVLLFSLPITLVWANLHGSIFLDVTFFISFSGICLVNYYLNKDKLMLYKFKVLSFLSILTGILSILPPLGFTQYRLLWSFFQNRILISKFIEEWTPLISDQFSFFYYSATLIFIFTLFIVALFKHKQIKNLLWIVPLLPFPFLAYTASRNVFLGYIALTIILGWSLTVISHNLKGILKTIFVAFLIILTVAHIWIFFGKRGQSRLYYPVKASSFIKQYDLQGNMFNEYGYGGFLLYHLYPQKKVFIDGRTDLYLCCEMIDVLTLSEKKTLPDDEYKPILFSILDKYQISYILYRTQKHSVLRKISKILTDDPNWNLIYWDDDSQIIVRRDGKNDQILSLLETKSATPYHQDPFREGQEDQALLEYQRMIKVADSAKSRNAVGYIYLLQKKYDQAKIEFEKAIEIDPGFESPYMNLAELAVRDKDLKKAVELYSQALSLTRDRGLIYIRLGQLYQDLGDSQKAKQIWQEGIEKTVDQDAKEKLKELLST